MKIQISTDNGITYKEVDAMPAGELQITQAKYKGKNPEGHAEFVINGSIIETEYQDGLVEGMMYEVRTAPK